MTPAVSVIITTFNRPQLLSRALGSLERQTFRDVEVVVVNDGGVDPAPVVDRHPKVNARVVTLPINRGVTGGQNAGIGAAAGRHIALLADDDVYLPHHLATLLDAVAERDDEIPYTDGIEVREDGRGRMLGREVKKAPEAFDRDLLLVTNYIPAICLLLPKSEIEAVGGFDEDLEVLEDWDLWIRMSERMPFRRLPIATVEYHVRGGRSNITTREVFRFHRCLQRVYAKHPLPDDDRLHRLRREMVEGSEPRSEHHVVEETLAVIAGDDPGELMARLNDLVAAMGDRSYEVVVFARRTPEYETLAGRISGAFSMVFYEPEAAGEIEAVARRRAAGRHLRLLGSSDGRLDPAACDAIAV